MNLAQSLTFAADPAAWLRSTQAIAPDPWQERFLRADARRIALNCCRQAGKSTAVGWRVAHRAMFRPGYFAVCTAPSDRQSLEMFQKIRGTLEKAGEFEEHPAKDNMHELVLRNGSRIICLPSNPDTIRGFSAVNELLVDEAGMVEDAVFAAVEPMMVRSKGSLVLMTTPKGQRGHFHSIWLNGKGWERYEVTWRDVLGYGHFTQADLDHFREEHGEWMFRQEYECQFLSTIDAVFPIEQIQKAMTDDEPFTWMGET
jgi:hypothetical protein